MVATPDFRVKDFAKDVLTDSHRTPVLVYYWADWCNPCKFLGPIVEELATQEHGKWELVKINIDKNEATAADWGIRSIPTLSLFYGGEVIDEVLGAMPKEDLINWLTEKLPSKAKTLTMEAAKLLKSGKIDRGVKKLELALAEDATLVQAKLLLAKQKLWPSPHEVGDILSGIQYLESAEEIILIAEVLSMKEVDFNEGDSRKDILRGRRALGRHDISKALEYLIKAIATNRWYADELARRLVLALFHYLGESHPITRSFRRKFDTALF